MLSLTPALSRWEREDFFPRWNSSLISERSRDGQKWFPLLVPMDRDFSPRVRVRASPESD